jgi:hypothetical protein
MPVYLRGLVPQCLELYYSLETLKTNRMTMDCRRLSEYRHDDDTMKPAHVTDLARDTESKARNAVASESRAYLDTVGKESGADPMSPKWGSPWRPTQRRRLLFFSSASSSREAGGGGGSSSSSRSSRSRSNESRSCKLEVGDDAPSFVLRSRRG